MKFTVIITNERDEEVVIYAREKTKLIEDIENLIRDNAFELIGYSGYEAVNLRTDEVVCFLVEEGKVYAITDKNRFRLKSRLYQLEETLPENFVKINQSCIANIKKIERFDTSVSGTLLIKFKNGYKDYVSRRQMKAVKERFGL